jgi:prophage antirepressor-like protein
MENQLTVFENKAIRSVEHNGEMYFSIVDIIGVLTDSPNHKTYWYVLKKREPQLLTICKKLKEKKGKNYSSGYPNTEGVQIAA